MASVFGTFLPLPVYRTISLDDARPKFSREDLILLGEMATREAIGSEIDRAYALDDIVEAHRYGDAGHKRDNVAISVA